MSKVFKTSERQRANQRAYRARKRKNPRWRAEQKRYMRRYWQTHKKRLVRQSREYQRKHATRIQLRRKGISQEEYGRFVAKFGQRCAICGGPPDGRWKKYNVDHCHKTKRMRGFLCTRCNVAIGLFRENPKFLKNAIRYLQVTASASAAGRPDTRA